MSKFWKAVRVTKWAALAVFLLVLAAQPWGWAAVLGIAVTVGLVTARARVSSRPPARHAR